MTSRRSLFPSSPHQSWSRTADIMSPPEAAPEKIFNSQRLALQNMELTRG